MKSLPEQIEAAAIKFCYDRGQNVRLTPALARAAMQEGAELALAHSSGFVREERLDLERERDRNNCPQ